MLLENEQIPSALWGASGFAVGRGYRRPGGSWGALAGTEAGERLIRLEQLPAAARGAAVQPQPWECPPAAGDGGAGSDVMGTSAIQWTDKTWTPLTGCARELLGGCDHCYAFQLHDMRHVAWKRGRWPAAPAQYHKPFSEVQLLPERLGEPLSWRKPCKVFLTSMGDVFHPDVPDEYLAAIWDTMFEAERHTFQVLTKRAARLPEFDLWMNRTQFRRIDYPNVWLGTSVENQRAADERVAPLMATPAAVRFLSMEPLLGPVDLDGIWGYSGSATGDQIAEWPIQWVILGGESGPHARRMDLAWLRDLIQQCRAADVAVFVKQLGSVWAREIGANHSHGGDIDEWPMDLQVREFPAPAEPVP